MPAAGIAMPGAIRNLVPLGYDARGLLVLAMGRTDGAERIARLPHVFLRPGNFWSRLFDQYE